VKTPRIANKVLSGYEPFRQGALYEGDCLDAMREMIRSGVQVDLVVTSPPYDDLRTYKGYSFQFEPTADLLTQALAPGGVIVWVVNDMCKDGSESGTSFRQVLYFKDRCGLNLHDTMVWKKQGFQYPSKGRYHQGFEFMFVLSKGTPNTFVPLSDRVNSIARGTGKKGRTQRSVGKIRRDGKLALAKPYTTHAKGVRTNVWELAGGEPGQKARRNHPASFPLKLALDHVYSWSAPGDVVFDPFLGSGTTAEAAIVLNRFWLGSECSSEYCEIIRKRVRKASNTLNGVAGSPVADERKRASLGLT
jgi:DNA modification methylase